MGWKEQYSKKTKPKYNQLLEYFNEDILNLFLQFDQEINIKFKVHNKFHRYEKNTGWVYGYGRNYNCELFAVTIKKESFFVLGVLVKDEETLCSAISKVKDKYSDGFEERYAAICVKCREDQIRRTKIRIEREKEQMNAIMKNVNPKTFNQFKWCKKVSNNDLLRLYKSEAYGMLDNELLDDIGITFYMRCTQAKIARE